MTPLPLSVDDYLRLPVVPATVRSAYGAEASQFGELFLPAGAGPHPVAIVFHGGCWSARYGLAPMSGLCAALASDGIAAWNLEYRRLDGGGGWPATFLDAAAGADHLRTLAATHALDLGRVIALGHSAGGHLALWLAARRSLPPASVLFRGDPIALAGVVALAALGDLAEGARRGLCGDACERLLGATPEERADRLAEASPSERFPLGVPHWHVVGELDTLVPADYVRGVVDLAPVGDAVGFESIAGAGHFEPVVPRGACWDAIGRAVRALLGLPAGPPNPPQSD